MDIPEPLSERFPVLDALEETWLPVSRPVFWGWLAFYILLMGNAALGGHLFQWFDLVFIPIHEGGHLLFRMFGEWIAIAGGTFLQLFVPFALAVYFVFQRQILGTTFCIFFFFEQFLPIGTYMADARAQNLPLLTVGDGDYVIHDWNYLFSHAGVLEHDIQIGSTFRMLGWIGMLATVAWFAWRSWKTNCGMPCAVEGTKYESPGTAPEAPHGRSARKILRHRIPQSVLAGLRAADQHGRAGDACV